MHQLRYIEFDVKTTKDTISKKMNALAKEKDDYHNPLYHPIRFYDTVADSYDDAVQFIEKHDNHDYDQLAVKFRDMDESVKKTAKHIKAEERYNRLRQAYTELVTAPHFQNVKSAFVSCRNCGSKQAVILPNNNYAPWVSSNKCPCCKEDMRPQSTLDRINRAWKNLEEAKKDLQEEEKKYCAKSSKIKWLVKIEYHV